jgi:hypothetical protein
MRATTLLFALALAASPAAAQGGMGGMGGMGGGRPGGGRHGRPPEGVQSLEARRAMPDLRNPVRMILDDSAGLALTADQASRLHAVNDKLEADNGPLLAQVRRTMGTDSAGGAPPPADDSTRVQRMDALKTYFDRIRWNNDQAWKDARSVLTRDQAKKADDLKHAAERQREERRERWQGRRGGRPVEPGAEPGGAPGTPPPSA